MSIPTTPKTTAEKIADLTQVERWAAADAEHEFDRRVIDYAVGNGIDPVAAFRGRVHVFGQDVIDKLGEGLERCAP